MDYCITQPLEMYDGELYGLYKTYRERPALLQAVLIMTSLPFQWEGGSTIPIDDRAVSIKAKEEGLLTDTLYCCMHRGGPMVCSLLSNLNPYDFYKYFEGWTQLGCLPLCRTWTAEQVLFTIKARAGAWLGSEFGSPLRPFLALEEVDNVLNAAYAARKEVHGR